MDLGADDALDYEDDTVGPPQIGSKDEKELASTKLLCGDDDYLQIDCPEEDELISGEQPLGSPSPGGEGESQAPGGRPPHPATSGATAEAQKVRKQPKAFRAQDGADEAQLPSRDTRQGKAKKQKIVIGDADSSQNNGPSDVGHNREVLGSKKAGKKCKAMKRFRPFRPLRKKFARNLSSTPWLPQYNFLDGTARELQHLGPLMSFNKGLAISNSLNGIASSSSDYAQQICQPLVGGAAAHHSPFLPSPAISRFNVFGNNPNFQCPAFKNSEPILSLKNDIKNTSAVEQDIGLVLKPNANNTQDCLLGDAESYFKRICFQNGNGGQLKEFGQKCEAQSTAGLLRGQEKYSIKLDALKEDEKALVKLKKEARLKRFMQNDVVQKEGKPFKQNADAKPDKFLGMKLAFVKLEKPELSRELLRQGDSQDSSDNCSSSLGASKLKKEVLLKKQNPFEKSDLSAEGRIKQEVLEGVDLKVKSEGGKSMRAGCVEEQVKGRDGSEVARSVDFGRPDSATTKQNGSGPNVKFVRTVSKSLVELGFAKPKTGVLEGNGKFPVLPNTSPFAKEGFQKAMEPHLTGCIVKVFNISPKMSANEIMSMCTRVGTVKEVKLNLPKENSAVIRFAESASAENFFGLYHGQKMDDYFLNVIVI